MIEGVGVKKYFRNFWSFVTELFAEEAAMIKSMATLRMTEADLSRNVASALDRVQSGEEIIIERDALPVAVLKAPAPRRRRLSEIMAALPEDSTATPDADFAADVQAVIDSHREPVHPPEWD